MANWQTRRADLTDLGILMASVDRDGRLIVGMRDQLDSVPAAFADAALAITPEIADRTGGIQRLRVMRDSGGARTIDFRAEPNADPRDLLDAGVDLLVSRDPALIEYARARSDFVTVPLPWSRTYVMLEPAGASPLPRSASGDAVRADARAAERPFRWEGRNAACADSPTPPAIAISSRVVYARGDRIAQDLAERIVGVSGSSAALRTAALNPSELSQAVATGGERAYILGVPRHSIAPCRDSAGWPRDARVQALIDTRAHAIVRRGSPPLTVEWDGTPKVMDEGAAQ